MSRPPFQLGTGGCACASCEYTAEFIGKPFSQWPRGNPAGKRSAAAYAAHVAYSKRGGIERAIPAFTISPEPQFSREGITPPLAYPSALVRDFISGGYEREKASPAEAEPARPADPAKDRQHFRGLNRQPEAQESYLVSATILAMPKSKPKRGRGRPEIPGRFVVVKLEERLIERAEKLGGGKVAAGIREALQRVKTG